MLRTKNNNFLCYFNVFNTNLNLKNYLMVRPTRLELVHPKALPPQDSVSTIPPRSQKKR